MALNTIFFFFSFLLTITSHTSSAQEFPGSVLEDPGQGPALDCFAAISEIRSCSNEIVAYFANGTIDISPPCCEAIDTITHRCWSAVLGVFGFGSDQADILRGYCDAAVSSYTVFGPGPSPSPIGQPLPAV
ncbi:hypothetical protein ACS0TY_029886 [Phlomoides rotata]